jgi:SAM-dependent methyltransferase
MFHQAKEALRMVREHGIHAIVYLFTFAIPFPMSVKARWKASVISEVDFWDRYFRTEGLEWADTYGLRFDPGLPLQPRPAQTEVHILDVGAGPLTYLGKRCEGKRVSITAVDPLADEYDKILDKYRISPLVRTSKLAAEDLSWRFHSNCFDLVFARNCLDHAYNPEIAIVQMVDVVKVGSYVLLEHMVNEGEKNHYAGLHQWNFSLSPEGDFMIRSRFNVNTVNMTSKYAELCTIACEIMEDSDRKLLITRIQKN